MYVALTRARHQAVIWWAGSYNSQDSPLSRLLFARDGDGNVRPNGAGKVSDEAVRARFDELAEAAAGAIGVEWARLGIPTSWTGAPAPAQELAVARFDRRLDPHWRRTSYSAITAGAHEPAVVSEPEAELVTDEPSGGAGFVGSGAGPAAPAPLPLSAMPVGARVGTFVHRVLEATDFAAVDLPAELAARVAQVQARGGVEIGDPALVTAGLAAAIETPFSGAAGALRLRDLRRADRLDELEFELPLAGGDTPTGRVSVAAVASVLRSYLPDRDPMAGYAARLGDPMLLQDMRGFLTGSIDLVFRLGGYPPRFGIVDYKSNWLGAVDEPLRTSSYGPDAVTVEIERAHYGLQALLYAVALHRYLRWRLPGYEVERDLAGVHYLFLRGMIGPATPVLEGARCGVFSWHPPGALVEALSDVLDGRLQSP